MAQEYALSFYNSRAWKQTQKAYMISQNYICERCKEPARIVHHKKFISPSNINDLNITLSWDNLMCVCMDCHAVLHGGTICKPGLQFDSKGNLIKKAPRY